MMFRSLLRALGVGTVLLMGSLVAQAQASSPPAAPGAPAARAANAADYLLAAGDVIRISVFQSPELSLEARLSESGALSYPLLGTLQLAGLSVSQAERRIADGLRSGNFLRQPQVTVFVVQVRGNQAAVLGQVLRPARFPLEQAVTRLSELLAMAGGIAPGGSDVVTVVGRRDDKPFRRQIDFPQIFAAAGSADDIVIQNGDVVYVDRMPMVYVYGEVNRPGSFRIERGMTVMQALALAGGVTARGTERGIRLHRKASDGKVQQSQPTMDDGLRDGDVIFIRESIF